MIHFIILANTKSDAIRCMTQNAINSIRRSVFPGYPFEPGKIVVIESNRCYFGQYEGAESVFFDQKCFNYNHALNLGLRATNASLEDPGQWFCFMNNDVECESSWLLHLHQALIQDNSIVSLSPRCNKIGPSEVEYGYTLGKHLQGYCFLSNSRALKKIGPFDETFDFYFQDDDYLEQLRINGLKHAVVKNSIVRHLGQRTTGQEDMTKLFEGRDKFVAKYSMPTYLEREAAKREAFN